MPKRDLIFHKPLMNAAGMLGFAPDFRSFREAPRSDKELGSLFDDFGAFVTNPISLRPRTAASQPASIEYPGGFLLHTGLPNPGLKAVLKKYARRWNDSPLPIIVHLMADRPEETRQMVQLLENMENVMAIELGFAPLLADDILSLTLEMCIGELPLVFCLPQEKILSLGPRLVDEGADAISVAAPRGALTTPGRELTEGRLFGPSLFPQSLEVVHSAAKLGLPIIGAGGVYSKENAKAMITVGALAVQMDAVVWRGLDNLPNNSPV
jgi:dihydroorotate dehydrogenase (NAD+) catalytic subunit